MPVDSRGAQEPGAVGYIGLLIIVAIISVIGYFVYSRSAEHNPVIITLSAYFVDDSGTPAISNSVPSHLKVKGEARQAGHPLKDGSVRLTVNKQDNTFEQAASMELNNGRFETEDPAFRSLHPGDPIHLKAEVSSSQLSGTATHEIYLNATPPALTWIGGLALWVAIGALITVFFVAFTGRKTSAKNRAAIIFSYCIIGIFLAVPLLAPVLLLHAFPNARRAMVGAPAGLVVTRIGNEQDGKNQWALNIGGYSTLRPPSTSVDLERSSNSLETDAQTDRKQRRPQQSANAPEQAATPQQPQHNGAQPVLVSPTTPPTVELVKPTSGDADIPAPQTSPARGTSEPAGRFDGVVDVEGGLVIPLYVIILSVIGGAINMTRKVPSFQREGEYSEVGLPSAVGLLETKVISSISSFKTAKGESLNRESSSVAQGSGENQGDIPKQTTTEQSSSVTVSVTKQTAALVVADHGTAADPSSKPATSGAEGADSAEKKPSEVEASAATVNSRPETGASEIDDQLNQLVNKQLQRNRDADSTIAQIRDLVQRMRDLFDSKQGDRILGFATFEDWLGNHIGLKELLGSNWRVELLNQYMYLISAPFLAIVAYYMLDLLGLTKQPILVLISFSVGLISERILSWLLGMASGYLRSDTSTPSPGAQGQ